MGCRPHVLPLWLLLTTNSALQSAPPFHNRIKRLIDRFANNTHNDRTSNITCPSTFNIRATSDKGNQIGHISIFSVTGRVGSSNLLSMLSMPSIVSVGEIFGEKRFSSLKLSPNINSPLHFPANSAHKNRIIDHIKRVFSAQVGAGQPDRPTYKLASIKFWHSWSNGVAVAWLARALFLHGCVSHFILISRNPVRITASEMYGHQHRIWRHDPKQRRATTCARAAMAFHIGGRWAGEMAVAQYKCFNDLLKLQEEFYDVKTLGISYESDILLNASVAFYKVTNFLQIKPNSIDNADAFSSMHHKGLLCPLSDMLINYDELTCTLSKFDNRVSLSVHPISWMASDVDLHNVTFESAMQSWNNLWEHIGWGHLQECSPADIRASSRFVRHAINISSSVKSGLGQCIVGEDTFACKHLPAVGQNQLFCLLAMHRMGCDAMTFKSNDGCYLHSKNATEFRIVKCSSTSYYRYVNSSKL